MINLRKGRKMWTKFLKVFFPCLINKPKKLEPFTKPKTEPSVVKKPTIKKKKRGRPPKKK
tara:strand:+ start:1593 stop:1772 length:180 start_codon:yes stop_codon:yes gene_type:complete